MTDQIVPRLNFGDSSNSPSVNGDQDNAGPSELTTARNEPEGLRISPERRRTHYLYQEYLAVARNPIEGIYIRPSARDPLEWFGVLIVRVGIYCGGMFRFTLVLPADFPDTTTMPVVKFDDNLFHPFVQPKTNIADLSRYFPSGWQRDRNHVYQILAAVQGMFFRCKTDEPAKAPNPEAALLIRDELHKFKQLARETVRQSRTQIYGVVNTDDENAINFTPWDIELEPFREYLVGKIGMEQLSAQSPRIGAVVAAATTTADTSNGARRKKRGFSWVDADHCQYMCDLFPGGTSNKSTPADTSGELQAIDFNGNGTGGESLISGYT